MPVLVLESSTSSAKALVFDASQGILREVCKPYPFFSPVSGVQNPETVYKTTLEAGQEAAAGFPISAISLSSIWHGLVLLDNYLNPLPQSFTWEFSTAAPSAIKIRRQESLTYELYHTTGCVPHSTFAPYIYLFLKENPKWLNLRYLDRDFAEAAKRVQLTMQGSYNYLKLTGEYCLSRSQASGNSLLSIRELDYSERILALMGIVRSQLPQLVSYEDTAPLLPSVADKLRVPSGIPVVSCQADGALNQVGENALEPGIMTLSVGTSAAMRLSVPEPRFPQSGMFCWNYDAPTTYLCGCAIAGGTNCIEWFRRQYPLSYEQLETLILNVDAPTPVFLPFPYGERCPGWRDERRGGFAPNTPLDGFNKPNQLYTGILEGICFNLRQCFDALVELNERPNKIILSGGILRSPGWRQMLADVLQVPLTVSWNQQASMRGAAQLAMLATEEIFSFADCFPETDPEIIEPKANYQEKYEKYLQVYNEFHD